MKPKALTSLNEASLFEGAQRKGSMGSCLSNANVAILLALINSPNQEYAGFTPLGIGKSAALLTLTTSLADCLTMIAMQDTRPIESVKLCTIAKYGRSPV
ncbi:hypothetical protein J1614_003082 [Plenodomus biglobosus]|nr:hypothetical protein J1614_003082 [Plenodomus biglobosus]